MKIFLDTADINELKKGAATGVVDGVTTNPSLVAKTGKSLAEVVEDIVKIVDGPVSVETISTDASGMIAEGEKFAAVHKNIVVKLPMTVEGVKACKELTKRGIRTNVTLVFSATQAWLAAKAGATYVSPFVGRLDDVSSDGMILIKDIVQIFKVHGYGTQVLAASLRHPIHVLEAAKAGAHVGTLPYKVFEQLFEHPLTKIGLDKFLSDWNNSAAGKRT